MVIGFSPRVRAETGLANAPDLPRGFRLAPLGGIFGQRIVVLTPKASRSDGEAASGV